MNRSRRRAASDDRGPLSYTFNGNYSVARNVTINASGISFGAAGPKLVVITVHSNGGGNRTINAASIDGVTAEIFNGAAGGNCDAHQIWAVTSATSGTVSMTFSSISSRNILFASYSIFNYSSTAPHAVGTVVGGSEATRTTTIIPTVQPTVIIANVSSSNSLGSSAWTGTAGVTVDYNYSSGNDGFSTASVQSTATGSLTAIRAQARTIMSQAWS